MSWLKRRLPKKRWKRVLLYFISVLLILLAGDMALVQYWRHIDISYETTRVTSPLTDRGLPDYLAALNAEGSQGVTADNNAAPLLIEIFGTKDMLPKWRDSVQAALGMPTGEHSPLMVKLVDLMRQQQSSMQPETTEAAELMDQKASDLANHLRKTIWRSSDEPQGTAWIAANEKALTLMHEAVSRPKYWVPAATSVGLLDQASPGQLPYILLPLTDGSRFLSRLTIARAMQRLGDHDVAGFQEDIIDAMKLARLTAQGPFLINLLVAYAQETWAMQAMQLAGTSGMLTEAQARELLKRLEAFPPLPDFSHSIDPAERYSILDQVVFAADQGLDKQISSFQAIGGTEGPVPTRIGLKLMAWLVPVHYNKVMRHLNYNYDRMRDSAAQPRYADRLNAMNAIGNEFKREGILAGLMDPGEMLVASMAPALGAVLKNQEQVIVTRDMTVVSLELAIHKARSGEYPETLAALVPGECNAVPPDGFVDKPLIYRRQGAGYLLYSVGPDGQDDGGIPREQAKNGKYDIVVRAEK